MPQFSSKNVIVGIIIMILFIVGYSFARSLFSPTVRSVTTSGVGKKLVDGNKAIITFTISENGTDRTALIKKGDDSSSSILRALSGVSPTDVRKTTAQVNSSGTGFRYVIGMQVTVSGKDNITNALTTLSDLDATLAQIRYLSTEEASNGEEARKMAIEDAKLKAEHIAKASKSRIGKVLSVSEQGANEQTGTAVTTTSSIDDTSFSQIEVQSALTVTFELK